MKNLHGPWHLLYTYIGTTVHWTLTLIFTFLAFLYLWMLHIIWWSQFTTSFKRHILTTWYIRRQHITHKIFKTVYGVWCICVIIVLSFWNKFFFLIYTYANKYNKQRIFLNNTHKYINLCMCVCVCLWSYVCTDKMFCFIKKHEVNNVL